MPYYFVPAVLLTARLIKGEEQALRVWLLSAQGCPTVAPLAGVLFEALAHKQFDKGGSQGGRQIQVNKKCTAP